MSQLNETRRVDNSFGIYCDMDPDSTEQLLSIIKRVQPDAVYVDAVKELDLAFCMIHFYIWHSLGCKVIVKVSNLKNAKIAEEAGCDEIIMNNGRKEGVI